MLSVFAVGTSVASPSASVAAVHSFGAAADATVIPARHAAVGARSSRLLASRSPRRHAYLRFRVRGIDGPVLRARLLLYSWAAAGGLAERSLSRGGNWSERSVSGSRPPLASKRIGRAADLRRRRWAIVDVTRAVKGNGDVNLALLAAGRRPLRLSSRESKMEPRLEVVTSDQPRRALPGAPAGPGATLPGAPPAGGGSSAGDDRAPTAPSWLTVIPTPTALDLAWGSSTDNAGVASYRYLLDGVLAGTTTVRSARIAGLLCGTTHAVSVVAVDAAGNASSPRTSVAATAACPPVPASVFVAPGGNDSRPCTNAAAPCATFDRAYRMAEPGEVVELAAGSYPGQRMTADASKSGAAVALRPASGAAVVVDELEVEGASGVTFQDIAFGGTIHVTNADSSSLGSRDVTFESVTAQTFRVTGRVARIAFVGGSFGNTVDNQPQVKKYDFSDPDAASPQAILIEGVRFSDFRASSDGVHTECLQLIHASGLTVRASRLDSCDGTGAIGVTDGPLEHLTFENNFIGKDGDAYFAVQMTKNSSDVVVRNNTMTKGMILSDSESGGPWLLEGNYMPFHGSLCTAGATHLHNVYAGGKCSASDVSVSALQVVDADGFDLHLKPGSNAIGRANPASFPAYDIDGDPRPLGAAADAGADEIG